MSIEKNTDSDEIGGSEMGIKVLVYEIMPKAINIAGAQQDPLRVLVDIVNAVGRNEHPAIIEKIGHEYLWDHRYELPWLIQPPSNVKPISQPVAKKRSSAKGGSG